MKLEERIEALVRLGVLLDSNPESLDRAVQQAFVENRWFVPRNSYASVEAIRQEFLQEDALRKWVRHYDLENIRPRAVGLIVAGNIPLVGFHDLLAVFLSGHIAKVKLSDKDTALMKWMVDVLAQINPKTKTYIRLVEKLEDFDAVIATGSDNTARYFETYFGQYPHIIRHNRNSVAILTGQESREELYALGQDIFSYFGLGCRNVSKIYVPQSYDFQPLLEELHKYKEIILNDKYKNNFDYAFTLYIMNKEFYMNNGCIILHEAASLSSRISTLHYGYYGDLTQLYQELAQKENEIQCVVATSAPDNLPLVPFGKTQTPGLMDYADGVDVMQFLERL
ncbi:MAG TPA: acyl-CoA reductase [Saprospiraceae bacterium]|nr:acyl-CoA reductase [Saprospiraceae bacterium]